MKPKLDLRLTQKLVMTPQLQQAIKLLQLSRLELSQVVEQEMVENPLLEEVLQETLEEESNGEAPDENSEAKTEEGSETELSADELRSQWEDYLEDDFDRGRNAQTVDHTAEDLPSYEQTLTRPTTLLEHMVSQLDLVRILPKEREIGLSIIGNIDENGYLRLPVEEIARTMGIAVESVEEVLGIIQGLDPSGIGARDLAECLLIQLRDRGNKDPVVESIIRGHMADIEDRKYKAVARSLNITLEDVVQAVKVIEGLEPKPGRPFFLNEAQTIIPDVYVVKTETGYEVMLNEDGLPRLHISPFYRKMLTSKAIASSSTRQYLNEHFKSAIWLIRSIEQRNRTIFKVATSIVEHQKEFLDRGLSHLRPLVLRQVAEDISMHESTISRVTTNKYIHTHQGIFELKFFFTNSVSASSDHQNGLSSVSVREVIRGIVDEERSGRPLKDQEIVDRLKEKDIHIARRTVAKYRTELNIPSATRRRRFK
jgi:RNA polymerase sigma-54 factor